MQIAKAVDPVTDPVTAPAPKPAAVPVTVPVTASVTGCEQYKEELSKYDWNIQIMMAIMQAESSCNPAKVGDNYPIAGLLAPSCGLFQVRTLEGRPSCDQLKDPRTNVEWAHKIFSSAGLHAWSVFQNGQYLRFM